MKSLMHHEFVSIGSQNSTHRIILLHGWGADADDLIPLGKSIINNLCFEFELISLQAPAFRSNDMGRQWYSLFPPNWNEAEIAVDKLIETLNAFDKTKISLNKTVLLGFSQGGAMALDAGLRLELGLIVSCSGFSHPKWTPQKNNPVLLSHGLHDEIVPIEASREISIRLRKEGNINSELHEYNCLHTIDPNFIEVIRSKIKELF
tara:strand:+ start:25 stop:639 length:615 start_codon:yes stop_codon:yes gene_type:complete